MLSTNAEEGLDVDDNAIKSDSRYYSQFISKISTFVSGGARLVLLAWHTSLELRCCLPTLGKVRVLTVMPSGRCS